MAKQFSMIDMTAPQRVRISWEMLTPRDDYADRPDENDCGFWPSLDPDEAGYIGDAAANDIDGKIQQAKYDEQMAQAEQRMANYLSGAWEYVGVVARAKIFIPIGGNTFRMLDIDSAGVWGVESDSGEYLRDLFKEQRTSVLSELSTLARALGQAPDFDEELPE